MVHPYTKGYDLKCYEFAQGCAARVINCEYFGTHADYAEFDAKLVYMFFANELDGNATMKVEEAPAQVSDAIESDTGIKFIS